MLKPKKILLDVGCTKTASGRTVLDAILVSEHFAVTESLTAAGERSLTHIHTGLLVSGKSYTPRERNLETWARVAETIERELSEIPWGSTDGKAIADAMTPDRYNFLKSIINFDLQYC